MGISAIHLIDEGVYLVDAQWGEQYEVDGLPMPQKAVVQSLDSIVKVVRKPGQIVAYTDDDGARLTAAEYSDKIAELLAGTAKDEDGNHVFPNLDAEFEYRKFRARWSRYELSPQTETREPVTASVVEVRVNSGDTDIVSMWNSPHVRNDVKLYTLNRDAVMVRAARELCTAAGLAFDNENRTYLRFAKIAGDYAFSDAFNESRPFVGTVEQCRTEKAACIDRVERSVRPFAAKKQGIQLANAGDVLQRLQRVQTNLTGVRSKQDTSASLSSARKDIADLIEGIHKAISA